MHFKFLDASRGIMAIMVVNSHSMGILGYAGNYDFIKIAEQLVAGFGLAGFFLLSSFLLTYRLYEEMDKVALISKDTGIIICKYFIRRFMRIYVVYAFYVTFYRILANIFQGNFDQM